MKPRLLDLFCSAGGATRGYQLAGFHVTGVDVAPQPRYVGDDFHRADALTFPLDGFDVVHASPPCQAYTSLQHRTGREYPDLLAATRERLQTSGLPYVIENVEGAPLRDPVWLCGSEFGLSAEGRTLRRHRGFESNVLLMGAGGCMCSGRPIGGVYGTGGAGQMTRGYKFHPAAAREVMGIDWMSRAELSQAIPPVFALFIGEQLLSHITAEVAS